MRVVLAERSIYIISVESAKSSLSPENVEKFLASFTLEEN
jgi:predicted Ser/Thr protein kinase